MRVECNDMYIEYITKVVKPYKASIVCNGQIHHRSMFTNETFVDQTKASNTDYDKSETCRFLCLSGDLT